MSRHTRIFGIIGFLLLVGIVSVPLTSGLLQAQDEAATATLDANAIIPADVHLRSGPSRDYPSIGQFYQGQQVRPLNRSADGDWILVQYGAAFGWLRRDLVQWVDNVDELPVLLANTTPTILPDDFTATPFFPTETPEGNWANVDENGAYLRAGPGQTFLVLGALHVGDLVEPLARTENTAWILIRNGAGFAWVRADLIYWDKDLITLPVYQTDGLTNLTPSLTYTPSSTPTPTITPSVTATSTGTITPSYTWTPSHTPTTTFTPSATATATLTPTITPSNTATLTPSPTATAMPSDTPSPVPTDTPPPTITPSDTATLTPSPTATAMPSDTPSPIPTDTPAPTITPSDTATLTPSPTATNMPSDTPSLVPTNTPAPTITPSDTPEPTITPSDIPSDTPVPTDEPTATDEPTQAVALVPTINSSPTVAAPPTFTPMPSPQLVEDTAVPPTIAPTTEPPTSTSLPPSITPEPDTPAPTNTLPVEPSTTPNPTTVGVVPGDESDNGAASSPGGPEDNGPADFPGSIADIPQEYLFSGVLLVLLALYILFYAAGAANAGRYAAGFVIETCPVCQKGQLDIVERKRRLLGLPRVRRTVHCDYCGSVLRQVGRGRWRYTVDGEENPTLFEQHNGREITDQTLAELGAANRYQMVPQEPPEDFEPPEYVDGE